MVQRRKTSIRGTKSFQVRKPKYEKQEAMSELLNGNQDEPCDDHINSLVNSVHSKPSKCPSPKKECPTSPCKSIEDVETMAKSKGIDCLALITEDNGTKYLHIQDAHGLRALVKLDKEFMCSSKPAGIAKFLNMRSVKSTGYIQYLASEAVSEECGNLAVICNDDVCIAMTEESGPSYVTLQKCEGKGEESHEVSMLSVDDGDTPVIVPVVPGKLLYEPYDHIHDVLLHMCNQIYATIYTAIVDYLEHVKANALAVADRAAYIQNNYIGCVNQLTKTYNSCVSKCDIKASIAQMENTQLKEYADLRTKCLFKLANKLDYSNDGSAMIVKLEKAAEACNSLM